MPIIETRGLKKVYNISTGAFSHSALRAVDGVDFDVEADKVFSIVGESGCGKSTVARLLLKLIEPTEGSVLFNGENVFDLKGEGLKKFRKSVQIIFQDPFSSLNPRRTVFETISEPLEIHKLAPKAKQKERARELLSMVGLGDVLDNYPHEFSGGQRQRICIARALSVEPKIIVADEPLSALDVSVQAQILNLLIDLKQKTKIGFVFISHDLRVVEYFSDRVAVMYLGKIVESAPAEKLFENPLHPYTNILLASAPKMIGVKKRREVFKGEVPSPINIPAGCSFHPRCPKRFAPCDKETPVLKNIENNRSVACHLY